MTQMRQNVTPTLMEGSRPKTGTVPPKWGLYRAESDASAPWDCPHLVPWTCPLQALSPVFLGI